MEIINQTNENETSLTGWTVDEKKMIVGMVHPLVEMQKAYGRDLDIKLVLRGWEMALAEKYNGFQVCEALKQYIKQSSDFPAPADLIKIIEPPKERITQHQIWEEEKKWRASGCPAFSYYHALLEEYHGQETGQQGIPIGNKDISKLVNNSVKRIG